MASVALGLKRPFSTMQEDSIGDSGWPPSRPSSTFQDVGMDVPSVHAHKRRDNPQGNYIIPTNNRSAPRTSPTPTSTPAPPSCRRIFEPNASIVLVGIRGTGKSTLAVIASGACRRRVIDIEAAFHEATGFSTSKYRKQFGAPNHNLRQEEILRNTLQTYDKGAVIVCNGSSLERSGQTLIRDFSKTHPVIHVVRDLPSIHQYLELLDMPKLQEIVALSGPIFRRCSNYEFYNMSETHAAFSVAPANQPSVPAFLTLKRAERTFLKFLQLITGQENSQDHNSTKLPPFLPSFPLSEVPTERRKYTYAVQVPLPELLKDTVDIEAFEFGSDAFEIVVDPAEPNAFAHRLTPERVENISRTISRVRRSTVVPIIYHVMPGSEQTSNRASYLEHVLHGLRTAPEYATIDLTLDEETILDFILAKGSTKIIGHLHSTLEWSNPLWTEKYDLALKVGCDMVRFTRPAIFMEDNAAIQSFRNNIKKRDRTLPLICFNTGRAGRRSACFNEVLTSVIPESLRERLDFADLVERNPETAWLTAREATHAMYASFTHDPMKIYIIGASAGYSLSPAMHNAAYKTCGMPHNYQTHQTPTLKSLQELVRDPNFGGTAITLPFKIEVISLTYSLSQHARAIGAVNTLIPVRHLSEDGSIPDDLELFHQRNQAGPIKALYGDNTDWIGIRACIRRGLSPANAVRQATSGLIIGSGGMARAAVYAMLQLGVRNIVVYNRTIANAENLVAHFTRLLTSASKDELPAAVTSGSAPTFRILQSRDDAFPSDLRPPTIILSCIPTHAVGDNPAPNFTLPPQWMESPTGGVVIELAYRTLNTPLMKQVRAQAAGAWICLDGLDLLPEQGFGQFELFTGKRAPRRIMREEVLRAWTDDQGESDPKMVQTRLEAIDDQEP